MIEKSMICFRPPTGVNHYELATEEAVKILMEDSFRPPTGVNHYELRRQLLWKV